MSALLIIFKKTRRAGIVILAGLVIVAGANNFILKPIVHRLRPFLTTDSSPDISFISNYVHGLDGWGNTSKLGKFLLPDSYSFMSGHTLCAFIFGFAILFYHPKWSAPALIFFLFNGFFPSLLSSPLSH